MSSRISGLTNVWKTFNIVDGNGKNRTFCICDIPKNRYEESIDFAVSNGLLEIPFYKIYLTDDLRPIEKDRKIIKLIIQQGISIAAFEITNENEKPVFAGVNFVYCTDNQVEKEISQIEIFDEVSRLDFQFTAFVDNICDPKKLYKIDRYLGCYGLYVRPNDRNLGVGKQLLQIREQIGRKHNIPYTFSVFLTPAGQRVAAKLNYDTIAEGDYVDSPWTKLTGRVWKLMGKRLF